MATTKTNKEKEAYLRNVFQLGVSRCLLLCEQNTVPRKPHFVLIPPYKRVLMGVPNSQLTTIVSAEYLLTTIFLTSSQLTTNFG